MHTIYTYLSLAAALAMVDANHDSWDAVQWCRDARAMARDLAIPYSVTDRMGRPIVDRLPRSPELTAYLASSRVAA